MWHVYKITLEFFFLIKNYKHLLFQTDYFTMINYEFLKLFFMRKNELLNAIVLFCLRRHYVRTRV